MRRILFGSIVALSIIWTLFVSYYYYNPELHPDSQRLITDFIPFLLPVSIATLVWFGIFYLFQDRVVEKGIRLPWLSLPGLLVLTAMLLILVAALDRNVITFIQAGHASISVACKLLTMVGWISLLSVAWYLAGRQILALLSLKLDKASEAAIALGLGYGLYTLVLLVLAALSLFTPVGIAGLLLGQILLGFRYMKDLIRAVTSPVSLNMKSFYWQKAVLGWLVFLPLALSLATYVEPLPSAWDSVTRYFPVAKELATSHRFVNGQYSYPVEMVYASGFSVARSIGLSDWEDMFALATAWWGLAFSAALLIYLGKRIHTITSGLLAASVYVTMPIITFYGSSEPKNEITLSAFSLLLLFGYFLWRQEKTLKYFVLVAIFSALLFSMKATSLFYLLPLAVLIAVEVIMKGWLVFKKTYQKQIIVGFVLGLIITLPWIGMHLAERNLVLEGLHSLFAGKSMIIEAKRQKLYTLGARGQFTGFSDDYGRYSRQPGDGWITHVPLVKYLVQLWDVSVLTTTKNYNFMISSLFIIMLPIVGFLRLVRRDMFHKLSLPKEFSLMVILSVLTLGIWLILGLGVVWYAMPVLPILSLLVAQIIIQFYSRSNVWLRASLLCLLFLNFLLALTIQASRFGKPSFLAFAVGKSTKAEVVEQTLPGYQKIASLINNDEEIQAGEKFVIVVGSYIPYFLDNYFSTTLEDQYLDMFGGLYSNKNGNLNEIKKAHRTAGVKYILFDAGTDKISASPDASLSVRTQRFWEFAQESLILKEYSKERGLLLLEVI